MKQEAIDLYNKLTAEWNKKPQNFQLCLELLNQLKVLLNSFLVFKTKIVLFKFYLFFI